LEVPTQVVVAAWNPSAGQAPDDPVQVSATSHGPAESRQVVVAGTNPSTQWPAPSQESVPSQTPPFDVPTHVVVAAWNPSPGHAPELPVQLSATSHGPADGRQVVVCETKPSTQWPAPSHESVPSQTPPFEAPTQAVVAAWKPSAGQAPDDPVQLSATSHEPVEGRQVVVCDKKPSAGQSFETLSQLSATSHGPAVGRQIVVEGFFSSMQPPLALECAPSQTSARSQSPAASRQVPPALPGV
jgi:hypothetical protein